MPINLTCSSCSSRSKAPDCLAGQRIFCPRCGTPLVVPSAAPAAQGPASGGDGGGRRQPGRPAPIPLRGARPRPPDLPPNPPAVPDAGVGYYVATHNGHISGPYSSKQLKQMVREGQLDLAWKITNDRINWCPAGQVKHLIEGAEAALAEHLPTGEQYRSLTKAEVAALFLDKFVLNNDNFKDTFPWLQPVRVLWAKLTMPRDFVITEVTASGVRHVRYNTGSGEPSEVSEKEVSRQVEKGVRQFNWFVALAGVMGAVWLLWTARDFLVGFSLTWGTLKTLLFLGVALFGFVMKVKHSKVFVGYSLDDAAARRLGEIAEALKALRHCSQVWIYRLTEGGGLHWKYNAGESFKVGKLPMAFFTRGIPNVETNVRVQGISHQRTAFYFLPEKVLVVSGEGTYTVPYQALQLTATSLEYVEDEGHVYQDSQVIGHRWKFINRDGSKDRRFKDNVELPVVRCGILCLNIGRSELKMMTTSPDVPLWVQAKMEALKAAAPTMQTSESPALRLI